MKRVLSLAVSAIATVAYLVFVIRFQKFNAYWGPFSVVFLALVLGAIVAFLFFLLPWFREDREPVPVGMLSLCIVVVLVSLFGGVYMTEPVEPGAHISQAGMVINPGQPEHQQAAYYNSRAGGTFYYWFYGGYGGSYYPSGSTSSGSSSSSGSAPSCSGKSCEGMAYVFLVILAIIVILGSLFVPSFWVAGALCFVIILWMITLREWFLVDYGSFGDSNPFETFEKWKNDWGEKPKRDWNN